jgi:hypothetical protein
MLPVVRRSAGGPARVGEEAIDAPCDVTDVETKWAKAVWGRPDFLFGQTFGPFGKIEAGVIESMEDGAQQGIDVAVST